MRVIRRLHHDEGGAVLVLYALGLVVILGMLALTLDLGRAVGVRRNVVDASDSAALAAAQQCAMGNGSAAAQVAADGSAVENDPSVTAVSFDAGSECDSLSSGGLKYVTVRYGRDMDYLVAPVLGFDSIRIETTAVAAWGPAVGVYTPAPIRISAAALAPCIGSVGEVCSLAYNNTDENSEAASQWGILNFPEGWPEDEGPNDCQTNQGGSSDITAYILPGANPPAFAASIPPYDYRYVCAGPGVLGGSLVNALNARAESADPFLIFPVMSDSVPPILQPGEEAYPIIQFAKLEVVGAWKGQQAREHCEFPPSVKDSSLFCIDLRYAGPDAGGFLPGTGIDYGLNAIRLVD